MEASIIVHKGKEVLFLDYTGCKSKDDMIRITDDGVKYLTNRAISLAMSDVNNSHYSKEYLEHLKMITANVFAGKIQKSASVGITGIKKILHKGFEKFIGQVIPCFDTKEEALNYLVS